jgi:hypothetical protein
LASLILASIVPVGLGEVVWDGPGVLACACLPPVLLAIARWLGPRPFAPIPAGGFQPIRAIGAHVFLGMALLLVLILVARFSWLAGEIVCGERQSLILRAGLAALLGAALGTCGLVLRKRRVSTWAEWPRRGVLAILAISATVGVLLFVVRTGPHDLARYPAARESPYRLPWKAGVRRLCIQGNRAVVSHRAGEEFAYDFAMPVGTEVCAARAGSVVLVEVGHDGHGPDRPNNQIAIAHRDGSFGLYLHLKKNGSYVRVGDRVVRGQRLGASGNVGISMLPHLHFEVLSARGNSLPVTFPEVRGDGIPRMFGRYTSENAAPP